MLIHDPTDSLHVDETEMSHRPATAPNQRVTVSLDQDIHERLLKVAKMEDRSLSSVVRIVINCYLNESKDDDGSKQ